MTFYKTLKNIIIKKQYQLMKHQYILNMTLTYGRSKSGTRVIKKTTKYPFKKYNLIFAISYNKIIGWILYEHLKGGIKKEQQLEFYNKYINKKYKNYLILYDNASPHKSILLQQLIKDSGNIYYIVLHIILKQIQ
jgi:hypothetical protein